MVVSATFVPFCIFLHSECIGGFAIFPCGNFSDRAFYSDFVFSGTLQDFCCRITDTIFLQLCVIFQYIFLLCVFNITVLMPAYNHFGSATTFNCKKNLTPHNAFV